MADCVTFDGVGKRFGDRWVLHGLSLALPSGQTTAIVGESGSGKTTLLQLVNGVYTPDAGDVQVMGKPIPVKNLETFRRDIGYAVQGAGLFPHMSVVDNVSLLARLEDWPADRIESRVLELFKFMGLDLQLRDRYPYQLSGGQQQRVGLCRALMLKPSMLLLDEPFSAIDPITRADIHRQFKALQAHEKVSTLLVTHDLREAVLLAHFLVIMAEGAIVQADATESVVAHPASDYVSQLLESQL